MGEENWILPVFDRFCLKGGQMWFDLSFETSYIAFIALQLHRNAGKKESRHLPAFARSGTGRKWFETAKWPNHGRMTIQAESWRGSGMEKVWCSDARVNTRRAGGAESIQGCAKENRHLDCPRLPLDASAKEIKIASVMFRKSGIFHLLHWISLSDVRTPKKVKQNGTEPLQCLPDHTHILPYRQK